MLRPKLILAFSTMALLTALCGVVSYYYVQRIGSAFSVFSEVTSPLLVESTVLIDNAGQMAKIVMQAVNEGRPADGLKDELNKLEESSQARLKSLRELAARAEIDVKLDDAAQQQAEYVATLRTIIGADAVAREASVLMNQLRALFDSELSEARENLQAISGRADGLVSESEENAKTQSQAGTATVKNLGEILDALTTQIYPIKESTSRLLREMTGLNEMVKQLAQSDRNGRAAIGEQAQNAFKVADNAARKLQSRLTEPVSLADFESFQEGIKSLRDLMFEPDGLLEGQSKLLTAREDIARGRQKLDDIDDVYFDILAQIQTQVTGRNEAARRQAAAGIFNAGNAIAGSILAAVLGALGFAVIFARRITEPVIRLAEHAAAIRETGEMTPLSDETIAARGDELGELARSFNSLIFELSDARRRLIDRSEAAIRTQYDRLNSAINNMAQGLCMFDAEQKLIICNRRYAEIYGLDEGLTQPGTPLRDILEQRVMTGGENHAKANQEMVEERLVQVAGGRAWYVINELPDGHTIAVSHQPMANGGSVATHEDITERRKSEAQIAFMAHHDALTGLPNRVRFRQATVEALGRVDRGESIAILCVDLDHFKTVNDTLGHPIGDALLQAVSERLQKCLRAVDSVARLGGDEFAIVQVSAQFPDDATALATRLIKEISEPYTLDGHLVVVGVSIGITVSPLDGIDPDQLLKKADLALYRAKEDGRGTYRFFEPEMDAKMQKRRALEVDLRQALALKQFELYYQALVNVKTQNVTGFEALIRWHHPERGMVPPDEFIPLAEDIGLINSIGAWVLKQACADAVKWPGDIRIAVNLSPLQFKNKSLVLEVVAALGASGLAASRLELEITETVLLQDTDATLAVLNQLRDLGVRISMDDFGTGYSSLGYLRMFPFDKIKIDRSFVRNLSDKPDSIAIVRAVAGLGATLGISTTAEGVETSEELRQIESEGCTEVQGYLFSKPKPASELNDVLARLNTPGRAVA